jgi:hypothetical protein
MPETNPKSTHAAATKASPGLEPRGGAGRAAEVAEKDGDEITAIPATD